MAARPMAALVDREYEVLISHLAALEELLERLEQEPDSPKIMMSRERVREAQRRAIHAIADAGPPSYN
jgi:hypothetical protein